VQTTPSQKVPSRSSSVLAIRSAIARIRIVRRTASFDASFDTS
jgi:hypothetical protein